MSELGQDDHFRKGNKHERKYWLFALRVVIFTFAPC